jgi:hypothetical protein
MYSNVTLAYEIISVHLLRANLTSIFLHYNLSYNSVCYEIDHTAHIALNSKIAYSFTRISLNIHQIKKMFKQKFCMLKKVQFMYWTYYLYTRTFTRNL